MRRPKPDPSVPVRRRRFVQFLLGVGLIYLSFLLLFEFPFVNLQLRMKGAGGIVGGDEVPRRLALVKEERTQVKYSPSRSFMLPHRSDESAASPLQQRPTLLHRRSLIVSAFDFVELYSSGTGAFSDLYKSARDAWEVGKKILEELKAPPPPSSSVPAMERSAEESCPISIQLSGEELQVRNRVMVLPCGLTLGSHITLVARPRRSHGESNPKIPSLKEGEHSVTMSQFMIELQGLKTVDGEQPPRILHFNPRLRGDWSGKPVIEQNTCYRMQWGTSQRCEGKKSKDDEETVDGLVKCEEWIQDVDNKVKKSKMASWFNTLIGSTKNSLDRPYPFVEGNLFVLTLTAGLEGFHVNVDGRHVTSFAYRTGFVLEDATGLSLNGDLDIESIYAASLPAIHPIFAPQRHLEMSAQWQAPPLPDQPIELFIGILSAGNHFAERMAIRKSWMSAVRESSNVVARFFVSLHGRKEMNMELKKEAEFFGDIVIVPYIDSYDLIVLKTVAICEYGEWPEKDYPPYADGPGYVVSADIAYFVISEFEKHTLKLFKMEDVSMGMWVERFNDSKPVKYVHNVKFCQFGCINDYYTSHYQSPRQMICLWEKLRAGRPQCCNMR
ncbi:hydroxyproline O-galactosyltransferase GALT6-like isoform X2 [Zingiber officinale]|uniref:hydroxyproline O-galactosyltransferase GALT6-like isoform X2 n=1 Tax=Zingiber officinale TaxID=94328 RepID=UPI001C4CB7A5|nr:hydroxyproline O-galactosyltransferase GALT6-like isoform X2 [Zingiber officinale]